MSAFKMESCFGADINVGYFDVEEILDIFGIKREVKNNPRVKRLIKLHGAKERIVAIVMRQVAIDLLKPDLEGSFLPYDGYFNDDLLLTSRRERLYDAQERFLMLCYSLANGRSVRSLKKLHAGLTTKEWREKHKRSVSLYKYFRQELNDHTRDYILSYKAGMEEESSTKEKASSDNTHEPSLEEQIPVLSEADSVSSLDVQSSEPKLILREKLEPTKFDKEITVALKILAEGRELLIQQVSNMNKGETFEFDALHSYVHRVMCSMKRNPYALMVARLAHTDASYLEKHILSVCILGVSFANALQLDDEKVEKIAVGCLLFDIGRFRLPPAIVNKAQKLTDNEVALFRNHIRFGAQALKKSAQVPASVYQMLFDHHEKVDGTGYPEGKLGANISNYGKIAAILDAYDSIISKQGHKEAVGLAKARAILKEEADKAFDKALLWPFLKHLGAIPVGACVEMSNGRVGFVLTLNKEQKPSKIRLVYSLNNKALMSATDIELDKLLAQGEELYIVREVLPNSLNLSLVNHL